MQPGSPIAVYPQNTLETLPMTRTPVYRLSLLDGLGLRIVGSTRGQGRKAQKFATTVRQVWREPARDAGCEGNEKLFGAALGDLGRISTTPQLKAAIEAIDLGEALADQVGGCALAGIAVIADHHGGFVEVGIADEIGDRVVVQMRGTTDMASGKACGSRMSTTTAPCSRRVWACSGGMRLNSLMGAVSFRTDRSF